MLTSAYGAGKGGGYLLVRSVEVYVNIFGGDPTRQQEVFVVVTLWIHGTHTCRARWRDATQENQHKNLIQLSAVWHKKQRDRM